MRINAPAAKALALLTAAPLVFTFFSSSRSDRTKGVSVADAKASPSRTTGSEVQHRAQLIESYGDLPLAFEENLGQSDRRVHFLSQGKGYELFLTSSEAVLALSRPTRAGVANRKINSGSALLQLALQGSSPNVRVEGVDKLKGHTDYFIGNNPKDWRTVVPSYSRVKYYGVYPGIDLIFYGKQQQIEYDFVVAPHTDPKTIALKLNGERKVSIDGNGNLLIEVGEGEVRLEKPVIYQELEGKRREVAGGYVFASDRIQFAVSGYDKSKPLIIDPVLNYSTYLGGSVKGDVPFGMGIAIDTLGNAYVAGQTFSTTFPMSSTVTGFNPGPPGANTATGGAVFVTELNPTGTQELYSTYLSGDGGEAAFGIALDATANIYVTGQTFSTNFPATANAFNPGPLTSASAALGHAFVSKINPKLSGTSSLVYSSYLAGNNTDVGNAVAADASGNAYIAGGTMSSSGFPTQGGFSTSLPSAGGNAFLTRIDTTKSTGLASLIYSTYLGGTSGSIFGFTDEAFGVSVDSANNAYLVGTTAATDFPTTSSAYRQNSQAPSGATNGAVFVSKINTTVTGSSSLAYSTYLSGPAVGAGGDFGFAITLGPNNIVYVAGQTGSSQFPVFPATMIGTTAGKFPSPPGSAFSVAFISKINTLLSGSSSLLYSTLLGGSGGDEATSIATDSLGNAYVGGVTASSDFPLTSSAYQMTMPNSQGDGFITKLSTSGSGASDLLYSTYFGGSGNGAVPDRIWAIAADSANDVYIAGQTSSAGLATPGTLQTTLPAGSSGAFVAKFSLIPTVSISPLAISFGNQVIHVSASQAVTLTNNTAPAAAIVIPPTITGANAADFSITAAASGGSAACTSSLAGAASCAFNVTFTPSTSGTQESATLTITYTAGVAGNGPSSQTIAITGTGTIAAPVASVTPSSVSFGGQLVTAASAAQTVTVKNTGTANLNLTAAPSFTGANASDFAIAGTSTCTNGAAVAPNSSCVINLTFTPPTAAAGARSATLTISDNASGSPQTVALTGTAWDFSLSAQAVTVHPGQTAAIPVTVAGIGGFTGTVTLSCTGPLTCTAPGPVTAPGSGNVTVMTIGFLVPPETIRTPMISMRQLTLMALALVLILALPVSRRFRTRLGLAGVAAVLVIIAGCSSSTPTPAGTYPMTISGASGGVTRATTAIVTVD